MDFWELVAAQDSSTEAEYEAMLAEFDPVYVAAIGGIGVLAQYALGTLSESLLAKAGDDLEHFSEVEEPLTLLLTSVSSFFGEASSALLALWYDIKRRETGVEDDFIATVLAFPAYDQTILGEFGAGINDPRTEFMVKVMLPAMLGDWEQAEQLLRTAFYDLENQLATLDANELDSATVSKLASEVIWLQRNWAAFRKVQIAAAQNEGPSFQEVAENALLEAPPEIQAALTQEREGDSALESRDYQSALECYSKATAGLQQTLSEPDNLSMQVWATSRVIDILTKSDIALVGDQNADQLAVAAAQALSEGNVALATRYNYLRGELLNESGDTEEAEEALREAVALARQVGVSDPFLLVTAYAALLDGIATSVETLALCRELEQAIAQLTPFNAGLAEVAGKFLAHSELEMAGETGQNVDQALATAKRICEWADRICHHSCAQGIRDHVHHMLHQVGREDESRWWAEEAQRYADWEQADGFHIPGHVHIWDLKSAEDIA